MTRRSAAVVFVAIALSAAAHPVVAAERHWSGGAGAQVNPLGLRFLGNGALRWPLSASSSPLLKDAHVAIGVENQLTPAYDRLGAWVELSPLSILDLRAGIEGVGYFGSFGNLVGFPSYDADFGTDARKALRDQARAGVGARAYLSPTLKLRAGRVSLRASVDFEWWRMHDVPGPFFYEPFRGTLLAAEGDALAAGSNLVLCDVSGGSRVQVGVYHEYLEVYDAPQNRKQRIGPMLARKLRDRRFGLREPVLYAALLVYLDAPDRGGLGGFLALGFGH